MEPDFSSEVQASPCAVTSNLLSLTTKLVSGAAHCVAASHTVPNISTPHSWTLRETGPANLQHFKQHTWEAGWGLLVGIAVGVLQHPTTIQLLAAPPPPSAVW